jgi:hypothetical protein
VGRFKSIEHTEDTGDFLSVWKDLQYKVQLEVEETIRGDKKKTLNLVLVLGSKYPIDFLAENHAELLFYVSDAHFGADPDMVDGALDGASNCGYRLLEPLKVDDGHQGAYLKGLNLTSDFGRMFGCDLSVVRGREAVLKRARDFAKKHKGVFKPISFGLPDGFFDLVGYHNAFGLLTLPACPETERTLTSILKDPDAYLKRYKPMDEKLDREVFIQNATKALSQYFNKEQSP